MEFTYFTLDKNPKQFKRLTLGQYDIELRIEWNSRSKAWYILGYYGNDIVIANTKLTPREYYSINIDSEYDLPYLITIVPEFINYNWDTETTIVIIDDPLADVVEGQVAEGGLIDRTIGTSSDTHSNSRLKGKGNKYLFDVVTTVEDTGITIYCANAGSTFKSILLPQGRWDFIINGERTIVDGSEDVISLMAANGVDVINMGNNEYTWINNSNIDVRLEGYYPYASGYNFNVDERSNDSLKIHSTDGNGWVNRFSTCLVPASSMVWNITSSIMPSDYSRLNFTGEKGVFASTAYLPMVDVLVKKFKEGVDPYTASVVNELTGVNDWVLDPANNQIVYTKPSEPTDPNDPSVQYYFTLTLVDPQEKFASLNALCNRAKQVRGWGDDVNCGLDKNQQGVETNRVIAFVSYGSYGTIGSRVANPAYDPTAENQDDKKTLPLETVAQQVISNAASGNKDAQVVVKGGALSDIIVASLNDDNMRQWQAVKDAAGGAGGSWGDPEKCEPEYTYYRASGSPRGDFSTGQALCSAYTSPGFVYRESDSSCYNSQHNSTFSVSKKVNPLFDPSCEEKCPAGYQKDANGKCQPTPSVYKELAEKIISNSNSSNQGVQLLAETYINEALLRFVDVNLLVNQFDINKTLK